MNLISKASTCISSLFSAFQVKRFLAVVLVGFLLLTTNVDSGRNHKTLGDRTHAKLDRTDSARPKTTGEWNQEARETANAPGERFEKIVEESGEALKEFGSVYPDTAKRSLNELKNNSGR
ncbi:MAG: hypothetical protein ACM37W_14570 [Actinomycetota bacterium]